MPDVSPSDWASLQQWWQAMGRRLQVEDRVDRGFGVAAAADVESPAAAGQPVGASDLDVGVPRPGVQVVLRARAVGEEQQGRHRRATGHAGAILARASRLNWIDPRGAPRPPRRNSNCGSGRRASFRWSRDARRDAEGSLRLNWIEAPTARATRGAIRTAPAAVREHTSASQDAPRREPKRREMP